MSLPIENVRLVLIEIENNLIHNVLLQKGILCAIAKECGFVPKEEMSYRNTSNDRLRKLFGQRLAKLTEDDLMQLKKDDIKFFDIIYGGIDGNYLPGDGWKYRGAGFDEDTGRKVISDIGKEIGVDLENYPEKLNEIPNAAKAIGIDIRKRLHAGAFFIKERYKTDITSVSDQKTAIQIAVNSIAGWGKDSRGSEAEQHAEAFLSEIEEIFKKITNAI